MGTSTIMYLFYRAMMAMSHFLEYFGGSIGIHLQVGMLSGRLGGNIYIYMYVYPFHLFSPGEVQKRTGAWR